MQIILKQRDIEAAVKDFVVAQGISIAHKSIEINFTAGRKETGISVEIDIEDVNYYQNAPAQRLQNPFIQVPVTNATVKEDAFKTETDEEVIKKTIQKPTAFEEKEEVNSSSLFA